MFFLFQVVRLRFTWNPNEPVDQRIVDVWYQTTDSHWKPFDQKRQYSITVSDFIVNGGDNYNDLAANAIYTINTSGPLLQLYVRSSNCLSLETADLATRGRQLKPRLPNPLRCRFILLWMGA